jgi:hypothetical protein
LAGFLVSGGSPRLLAAATGDAPDFQEVYGLLRQHLAGASAAELNRAAVQGLLAALGPRVALLTNGAAAQAEAADVPLLDKTNWFEDSLGYLRVGRVGAGLADAVREACRKLAATNQLKGLALDLRFAGGADYAAAAATVDLFLSKERPLLNWGAGLTQSKAKSDALTTPVAVLVNQRTAGAAEALAAVLRETGTGVILGSKTAGEAMMEQEFPLKNGDRLRIATAPVRLGDGSPLAEGVRPDIPVAVSPADERAYYADPFKASPPRGLLGMAPGATNPPAGTNSPRRPQYNEAQLVRERRESANPDTDLLPARNPEPERPQVRDPALARALDLLKGLALVRSARP